jgi:MFS superfamily sulfate permease-like transporter
MKTFILNNQVLKSDLIAGFMVFLLALPLSLGIAKASGFPAAMGVLTAIIGGIATTFFKVSPLTIKGPAAGLITICAGAVIEFGGAENGWKVAAAALIVMAIIQVLFALLKLGSFSDFFPKTAIHGMLAAIGIIIIAKQIPVLLGDEPSLYAGEGPLELLIDIPNFITHAHWHIAVVGLIGLVIMFGLPRVKIDFIKKIPAPMIVLLLTIPLAFHWHFRDTEGSYSLVTIGDFWGEFGFNFDFSFFGALSFWKYVFMFLFVNSLESLLTVKAVDQLDTSTRKADPNGDLLGLGVGNFVSGLLGGLPMISEVVRSSANVRFHAKTKWSNFFHGIFLLLSMIFLIPLIETIPNAALAAMLIYAGFRLASPSEFIHTYKTGKEQMAIFLLTIIVTLAEDLLLGIAAGILLELLIYFIMGTPLRNIFKARFELIESPSQITVKINGSAQFSNLIGFKRKLEQLPEKREIIIDFSSAKLVDHSFMSFITYFQSEYKSRGGRMSLNGLENFAKVSSDHLATRVQKTQS